MSQYLTLDNMTQYDFDTRYYADSTGNVFLNVDIPTSKVSVGYKIKSFINRYGYVEYNLKSKTKRQHIQAHRIVACLFIVNPDNKKYVNHIDGNKLNNDISNLEWVTCSENEMHSYRVLGKQPWNKGLELPKGRDYKGKIREVAQYDLKGNLINTYFNPTEASLHGFCRKQISAVCNNTQYTHKGFIWKYTGN